MPRTQSAGAPRAPAHYSRPSVDGKDRTWRGVQGVHGSCSQELKMPTIAARMYLQMT